MEPAPGHPEPTGGEDDVSSGRENALTLHIGNDEVVLRQRYEVASIANDLLIAVWFAIGSVLFFSESTATAGTWLFLLGSVQLMVRPAIRLARRMHIQRTRSGAARPTDASDDY